MFLYLCIYFALLLTCSGVPAPAAVPQLSTSIRLPQQFQDAVDAKVSDLRLKVEVAKDELSAAEKDVKDGDNKEKARERLDKAQLELALAELKLKDELRKAIGEQRMKYAEEVAKKVEEAVKAVEQGDLQATSGKDSCKAELQGLPPAQLFIRAAFGGGVGQCIVQLFPGDHPLCYMYVKAAESTADTFGDRGYPKQTLPDGTLSGSGCVAGEDGPKGFEGCIYRNRAFQIDDGDIWRLCQKFGFFNAVSALKLALDEGKCALSC